MKIFCVDTALSKSMEPYVDVSNDGYFFSGHGIKGTKPSITNKRVAKHTHPALASDLGLCGPRFSAFLLVIVAAMKNQPSQGMSASGKTGTISLIHSISLMLCISGSTTLGFCIMSGSLFIVAAPSGAGKTSLVRALVKNDDRVRLSVSHTTRTPREGERDGVDYFFVSQQSFAEMRDAGAFLESATVFDNSYGTSAEAVNSLLAEGLDVILEIDWQGAQQVRRNFADSISIFILPPSRATLEQRLRNRGQDDEATIARRMRDAENEMSHYIEFDYLLVNDVFEETLSALRAVVVARRHSLAVQKQQHARLLTELLA